MFQGSLDVVSDALSIYLDLEISYAAGNISHGHSSAFRCFLVKKVSGPQKPAKAFGASAAESLQRSYRPAQLVGLWPGF